MPFPAAQRLAPPMNAALLTDCTSGLARIGRIVAEQLYVQEGNRAWWRLTLPVREAGALPSQVLPPRRQA